MEAPNTTEEALAAALRYAEHSGLLARLRSAVQLAIAADRKALEEAGYAIIRRGEVPEWMELSHYLDADEVPVTESWVEEVDGEYVALYRLSQGETPE